MAVNKFDWVDVSKGIVITLMVIGHSSIPVWLSDWIWSFHMPFFFIISALFISWDKDSFTSFTRRKGRILLIPFAVYSVINLVVLPPIMGYTFIEYLVQVSTSGWGGIALWFVPVFFSAILICKFVHRDITLIVGLVLIFVGVILSYMRVLLPWTLSTIPFAAGMMLIVKRYQIEIKKAVTQISVTMQIMVLIVGAVLSLIISRFWRLDMCYNRIVPIIPILFGIVGGCAMTIMGSKILDSLVQPIAKIFKMIGRNTYEIMALSQVSIMSINFYLHYSIVIKYILMIIIMGGVIIVRRLLEGKYAKFEAI